MKVFRFFVSVSFFLFPLSLALASLAPQSTNPQNLLIHEKSPYLLQHADNPVNWFAWGNAAFEKARMEDKPIFLSIGYSTCHWCHVMEEESFANPEIAKILNENFVSIKVDREERPDIDAIYMNAVMKMTGSGGWPLNVFLNHKQEPFAGGTYFPPVEKWGKPSFRELIEKLSDDWKSRRAEIVEAGRELALQMQEQTTTAQAQLFVLDTSTLKKAYQRFKWQFDPADGGFGRAPKFPSGPALSFLLRYSARVNEDYALKIVTTTLDHLSEGGIRDHLGGGFHRYSTDSRWFLPHFEKMLYDQALIARTYLEAYQATGVERYATVAKETLDYVLRVMQSPQGAFYSAEDADSYVDEVGIEGKKEGAFYVWSRAEIEEVLGAREAELFMYHYGVNPAGNIEKDPHGEFEGKNVLSISRSLSDVATHFDLSEKETLDHLAAARERLLAVRNERQRPHLDDKILADWNGLMISTLAYASQVLDEERYRTAAVNAANFIMDRMKTAEGRLLHRYRDGEVAIKGFLDDYAFFSVGLLELYEATFDPIYLQEAIFLLRRMVELFWDKTEGGFFLIAKDSEQLIANPKELYDGAIPSGNSFATLALLKAARLTGKQDLEVWANSNFETFSETIAKYPSRFPQLLVALDFAIGPSREIVLAASENDPMIHRFLREIYGRFLPNKVVALHYEEGVRKEQLESLAPFLKKQKAVKGKATVYVCENHVCKLPTTDLAKLQTLLA